MTSDTHPATEPTAGEPLIDTEGIKALIPHRPPILMVDRVIAITSDAVVGEKTVGPDEPWFAGHFPGRPVVPGLLIVEGLAQLGGIYAMRNDPPEGPGWVPSLIGVDRVRFRRPVFPGVDLRYELRAMRHRRSARMAVWRFSGRALVDGELVCDAVVSAAFVREKASPRGGGEA